MALPRWSGDAEKSDDGVLAQALFTNLPSRIRHSKPVTSSIAFAIKVIASLNVRSLRCTELTACVRRPIPVVRDVGPVAMDPLDHGADHARAAQH